MSQSGNVNLLAARVADEFNTLRGEVPSIVYLTRAEYNGLTPDPDTLYVVTDGASTVGFVDLDGSWSSINADQMDGLNVNLSGAGGVQLPTGGRDHRTVQIVAYADGGERTFQFDTPYERLEGIDEVYTIPAGKTLRASLRRSDLNTITWIVEAVGITQ